MFKQGNNNYAYNENWNLLSFTSNTQNIGYIFNRTVRTLSFAKERFVIEMLWSEFYYMR